MKTRWKILIAVGAGILASYLINASPITPTTAIMQAEFDEYNRKYFDNQLENVTVIVGDLTANTQMGLTTKRKDNSFLITIDRKTNPILKTADLTMLHEMCHVRLDGKMFLAVGESTLDAHGPAHEACMLDLAKQGAMKDLW